MKDKILKLEKSLFKHEYMSNVDYLKNVIDEKYLEVGKSGRKFNRSDVINDLSVLKEDRQIIIYNFSCEQIDKDTYLVHYITKDGENNIYRTSIWKKEDENLKIIFHQASLYKDEVTLIEF